MPTTRGFAHWSYRPGKGNARLHGTVVEFNITYQRTSPMGITRIGTNAGTVVHQARFYAADVPLRIEPETVAFTLQVDNETDWRAFHDAVASNHAVRVFLRGYGHQVDKWSVPLLNAAGVTTVRTSRPVAYNGSTITQNAVTGYPPTVEVDGVTSAFTVPTSASGNAWDEVDVTGITGTELVIRYAKAPIVAIDLSEAANELNNWTFSGTFYDDPMCVSGLLG